jgi:hypothetical protein
MFSNKNIWWCFAVSIGVLAGIDCFVLSILPSGTPGWLAIGAWPGFVAWALYYAKGTGTDGMIKTITGNAFGIINGIVCFILLNLLGITNKYASALVLGIIILVLAFLMTWAANIDALSYVPAAFAGCACSFGWAGVGLIGTSGGTGTGVQAAIALFLSMLLGALLGKASDVWGQGMYKGE